jgi:hypothetical protein
LAPELLKTTTDIRPCLISGGKHKSKSSLTSSRGRRREVRWRLELFPDGRETWGKRSVRVRGLGLPKESVNGQANRWLTGDEWAARLTSAWRKKWQKGQIFPANAPSYRRRRERGLRWAPWVGDGCRHRAGPVNRQHTPGFPCLGWLTCGPRVGI